MATYDTAADIINYALIECGLGSISDPFASSEETAIQMRTLLTQCGRELASNKYQWQQLVKSYSFNTGATPPEDGVYDLPADFGYLINQTGWTPNNLGLGLPLTGPYTEQQWTAIIAQNLAASTVYIGFKVAAGTFQVLPQPAPVDTDITYEYMSSHWVRVHGADDVTASVVANADDVVIFESILITKMLAARYKQAKGLDAAASLDQFTAAFQSCTGMNSPAPVLNMATNRIFPLINIYTNTPPTGYGMA